MSNDETTRIISRSQTGRPGQESDETTPLEAITARRQHVSPNDDSTRIYRPNRSDAAADADSSAPSHRHAETSDYAADPVVGWLVIIDGPGKGKPLSICYGMNSIGRDSNERVSINFGDEEISRSGHAMLSYDPRGRKFYLQHGGGANLTYIGDLPVLQPTVLAGGEIISIGKTLLRFTPFCGPDFDWQDKF